MPASVRQTYKRELERAVGNIDSALAHLMRVIEAYKADYPHIAEPLELAATGLIEMQALVNQVERTI
jgi:hypothetical protein